MKNANTINRKEVKEIVMEYRNLQENIRKEEYNDRVTGILNWIKDNRERKEWAKDPNAFEMTNVFLLGSKYRQEGEEIDLQPLEEMWRIRSGDFEHAGVSEQSFVYRICEDSYEAVKAGKALVNDEASHHALRKMAGIGLYCSQQKRDQGMVEYDNPSELLELLEASRTLKGVHPDLYEKYQFQSNLDRLCELQPESSLQNRIEEARRNLERGLGEPVKGKTEKEQEKGFGE